MLNELHIYYHILFDINAYDCTINAQTLRDFIF